MPILTEQQKKQRSLIGVVALVLVITLVVLYSGVFRSKKAEPTVPIVKNGEVVRSVREVKLNLGLFKEEKFKNLIPYDKLPTQIETGRKNPFIPYDL